MKKTNLSSTLTIIVLLFLAGALTVSCAKKYKAETAHVAPSVIYPVEEGQAHLYFWQEKCDKNAVLQNGMAYLDTELVNTQITKGFFYEEEGNVVSFVTPTQILHAGENESFYEKNGEKVELKAAAFFKKGDTVYLSLEWVAAYSDITYKIYQDPARVMIEKGSKDTLRLSALKNTQLRVRPDLQSEILLDLQKGTKVTYCEGEGNGENGFVRVLTLDGILGFVRAKDMTETFFETVTSEYEAPEFTHILMEDKVVLGWHQVTNAKANSGLDGVTANAANLNVIAPTWFRIVGEDGSISSLADKDYVKKAKEKGLAVWGLLDNFDSEVSSYAVLSSVSAREKLIKEITEAAKEYELDGINIDFELLSLSTGPYYIEFLKELSTVCRREKLVLSVDNYVPTPAAAYYDWKSQGEVVDYVVIMAYDEHYAGSEVAGSVASYGYLTDAVDEIVKLVPNRQVIMAVPFYTRLWTEKTVDGTWTLTSSALGMQAAQAELTKNKVTPEWDLQTRQYYAEYQKGSEINRIWLEEEDSLREKLLYIKGADLAGAAVWRLGLETPQIWKLFDFENLVPKQTEETSENQE